MDDRHTISLRRSTLERSRSPPSNALLGRVGERGVGRSCKPRDSDLSTFEERTGSERFERRWEMEDGGCDGTELDRCAVHLLGLRMTGSEREKETNNRRNPTSVNLVSGSTLPASLPRLSVLEYDHSAPLRSLRSTDEKNGCSEIHKLYPTLRYNHSLLPSPPPCPQDPQVKTGQATLVN